MFTTRSIHSIAVMAFACLALLVSAGAATAVPADVQPMQRQDMRTPDTADIATQPRQQDLRAPDNAGVPTQPSAPITPAPAVDAVSDSGGGIGWLTIALGIAGGLLAVGAIVVVAVHARRPRRAHISA